MTRFTIMQVAQALEENDINVTSITLVDEGKWVKLELAEQACMLTELQELAEQLNTPIVTFNITKGGVVVCLHQKD